MPKLFEGFEVSDLENILSPNIHIDEFKSKLGSDDKNIVISFMVKDKSAAEDLVDFLERGYEFILDADVSTSEVIPGNYLVFAELLRRTRAFDQIMKILSDLRAASEIKLSKWTFEYMNSGEEFQMNEKNFKAHVPLSPKIYRLKHKSEMDGLKNAAGLPASKTNESVSPELRALQHAAGLR